MANNRTNGTLGRDRAVLNGAVCDGNMRIHRAVVLLIVAGRPADQTAHSCAAGAGDGRAFQVAVIKFDLRHGVDIADKSPDSLIAGRIIDGYILQRQVLDDHAGLTGEAACNQRCVQSLDRMAVAVDGDHTRTVVAIDRHRLPCFSVSQLEITVNVDNIVSRACRSQRCQLFFQLCCRSDRNRLLRGLGIDQNIIDIHGTARRCITVVNGNHLSGFYIGDVIRGLIRDIRAALAADIDCRILIR